MCWVIIQLSNTIDLSVEYDVMVTVAMNVNKLAMSDKITPAKTSHVYVIAACSWFGFIFTGAIFLCGTVIYMGILRQYVSIIYWDLLYSLIKSNHDWKLTFSTTLAVLRHPVTLDLHLVSHHTLDTCVFPITRPTQCFPADQLCFLKVWLTLFF